MFCNILWIYGRASDPGTSWRICYLVQNSAASKKLKSRRLLTCKNETGSFSLRASMQNCNRDVVFCSLHVQLVTWSFSDRCLISLSCRTASISHCLRLSMDRISASHLASTCRSNSSHSPCKHKPDNGIKRLGVLSPLLLSTDNNTPLPITTIPLYMMTLAICTAVKPSFADSRTNWILLKTLTIYFLRVRVLLYVPSNTKSSTSPYLYLYYIYL